MSASLRWPTSIATAGEPAYRLTDPFERRRTLMQRRRSWFRLEFCGYERNPQVPVSQQFENRSHRCVILGRFNTPLLIIILMPRAQTPKHHPKSRKML